VDLSFHWKFYLSNFCCSRHGRLVRHFLIGDKNESYYD
jgi:hypothetical protein